MALRLEEAFGVNMFLVIENNYYPWWLDFIALTFLAIIVLGGIALLFIPRLRRPYVVVPWAVTFVFAPILVGLLLPAVARVKPATPKTMAQNNLKQLVLAMHSYAGCHEGRFPPAAVYSKDGRPLLSWRVLLLPFLEEDTLYRKFKLDEPWDSPHNLALLSPMPSIFHIPTEEETSEVDVATGETRTVCQVFTGKGTAFETRDGPHFRNDFPNGTSNTILIVHAGKAVPWTKPEDLIYEDGMPLPPLGGVFPDGVHVGMADGTALFIEREDIDRTIRKGILRAVGSTRFTAPNQ